MSLLLLPFFFFYRAGRVRVLVRESGTVHLMVAALLTFELLWQLKEGEGTALCRKVGRCEMSVSSHGSR